MEYAKKMALVDPQLLENLTLPKRPASLPVKALGGLDRDMKTVLDRMDLDEDEKVKLYNQILQRYVSYHDKINQPLRVQITQSQSKPPVEPNPPSTKQDIDILSTVPPSMRHKAELLLEKLRQNSSVTWDDRGRVSIKGSPIESANITDLLNDVMRRRKRPLPAGWKEFAKELREANIPRELIGNKERWYSSYGVATEGIPRNKKKRVVSRPRWTPY